MDILGPDASIAANRAPANKTRELSRMTGSPNFRLHADPGYKAQSGKLISARYRAVLIPLLES
jgi:hypothetical protein